MENVFNQSIWGDEGFSAILSMKPLPEVISIISRDTSPPLWNIWEWLVFNTLGTDEVYIRGLAFTFFILSVFFTYKIGALLWSKKTGLLAATLTFLNPFFFTYAFEGRMYSILALGITSSMYFFLKILKTEKHIKTFDKVGYVVATLWALYSHHFAIFVMFIQGLWFLYEFLFGKRKAALTIFKLFILVSLGYLPWLYPLYTQTKMVGGGFWLGRPNEKDLAGMILEYLAAGIRNENLKLPFINYPLYQIALGLGGITLLLRQWHKSIKSTFLLLSWFLGPIVLTWIVSQKFQPIFFNRYLLYTIPAAMLILASNRRKISSLFLLLLLPLLLLIDYHYFTHPGKLLFKDLATFVMSTQRQGDFLINWYSNGTHHIWETKYYGIPAPIYVPGENKLPFFVGTALMNENDIISEIPKEVKRVGVVTSGTIEEIFLPDYTESEVKTFRDLKFVWYVKSQ